MGLTGATEEGDEGLDRAVGGSLLLSQLVAGLPSNDNGAATFLQGMDRSSLAHRHLEVPKAAFSLDIVVSEPAPSQCFGAPTAVLQSTGRVLVPKADLCRGFLQFWGASEVNAGCRSEEVRQWWCPW